ncbi:uncharacterized protein LOC133038842 [Cannabis sativa]|uniref:uncharacterized protein LOC133038842 n=1 Tax=Cannabis sativa TaxID=3483 RepID=UPI0029CAA1AB|nr:uncharacterized protein LOC133038842 [Cannabis sativa]
MILKIFKNTFILVFSLSLSLSLQSRSSGELHFHGFKGRRLKYPLQAPCWVLGTCFIFLLLASQMTGTDSEVVIIDNSEASVWPEKHEEIFIELMEEEVLKGNRNTTTFTKQSWKCIKEELYAQAKRSYTDTQLRNKYNLLRQKHKDFKSLLKETGIGFSVVTGQVTAPDEVCYR